MPPILHPGLLLLAPLANPAGAGDAECKRGPNTNCRCAENDPHCTFPTCVDDCTCVGGECQMDLCLANCHCADGGCAMESCMDRCENGGADVTPPLCIVEEELDPVTRGRETPEEVCRRLHWDSGATSPYACDENYACCTGNAKQIEKTAGMYLGRCTKDLKMQSIEAEGVAYEATARGFARQRPQSAGGYVGIVAGVCLLSAYLFWRRCFGHAKDRYREESDHDE